MLGLSPADMPALRPATSLEDGGYQISGFQLSDAADIPGAFETVYGRDYLNPMVYDPAGFAAVVASDRQISFIARDAEGDFAGHLALVFSAPNPRLVEVAQGIVLPAHRKSGIFGRLLSRAVDFAREELACQAVYGTALTNHAVSQRVLAQVGFRDVGLEVDYVPERMLRREGAEGPAATLVQYLDFGRGEQALCHLPAVYASWFGELLDAAGIAGERRRGSAKHLDRQVSVSEVTDMPRFDMARLLVRRAGFDFWQLVGAFEASAEAAGRRSAQVLVDLGEPEGAAAVEQLRGWGYACGGLLPGFVEGGRHLAIMYRSFAEPYFSGVRLHAAPAERLLAAVVADWRRAQGLDVGPAADRLGLVPCGPESKAPEDTLPSFTAGTDPLLPLTERELEALARSLGVEADAVLKTLALDASLRRGRGSGEDAIH